jgi:uncharacterized membrane protein (GlpM family)
VGAVAVCGNLSLGGLAMAVKFDVRKIKDCSFWEWLLRFGFGGAISVLASLAAKYFGDQIGGLFLAFPSILPATLTLVVHHRNRAAAAEDAWGASLGAVALIIFAALVWFTIENWGPLASLSLATAIWVLSSAALWYAVKW